MPERKHSFDALMNMKNAGAVTSTAVAQIASADVIIDLLAAALTEMELVANVTAIDTTSTDETYELQIQGCNSSGFGSSVVELASLAITSIGEHHIPFDNECPLAGVVTKFRYIRLRHILGGTTPSINYSAWLAPRAC